VISGETPADKWKRRAKTIPLMLGATALVIIGFPVIVALAAAVDLAHARFRFPRVRVAIFVVQYLLNDSVEILLAPILWSLAGLGTRVDSRVSMRRHQRLQSWSLSVMARRSERLLGLRFQLDAAALAALQPGPVIVLCRHINIVDASLPPLLYERIGYRTRGIITAELLADPGFDLIYARTGSAFIPREDGPVAKALINQLANSADVESAVMIFPEGRLFRPDALQRALARLADRDPIRAARLSVLTCVLPPRPGGVLALLDALPNSDVVVIAHAGLDRYPTFADLCRSVPLPDPIKVTAWRIAAADIPIGAAKRTDWLDGQWLRVDAWVTDQLHSPDAKDDGSS
jgi:1-acyl-sn-glycerol-3-phosphate acyltransferase